MCGIGLDDELDVGLLEVVPLEQERLAEVAREGVGEAVAHVEPRRAAARPPEALVGLTRDAGLVGGDWLYLDARVLEVSIEHAREHRIVPTVDDDAELHVGRRGDAGHGGLGNQPSKDRRIGFATDDRDDGRGIDNHRGRPRSS